VRGRRNRSRYKHWATKFPEDTGLVAVLIAYAPTFRLGFAPMFTDDDSTNEVTHERQMDTDLV
jgi:hypothetical protein